MITTKNLTRNLDFAKIDELLRFALEGKLEQEVIIGVVEQDRILDRLSTEDFQLLALTYQSGLPHVYQLIIRSTAGRSLEEIVFHESVHLRQYESGRLKVDPSTGRCTWDGQEYKASYPYRSRPWEIEAFREQDKLQKAWRAAKRKERRR